MKTKAPTAESKTRKDRIEYLRNFIDNHEIRKYISLLDTALDLKALKEIERQHDNIIHNYQDLDTNVRYAIIDAENEAEDRIRKAIKSADKLRIAIAKQNKLEAKNQQISSLNKYLQYPMLKDAIDTVSEAFRPDLINSFYDNKTHRLNYFIDGNKIEVPEPAWKGRGKSDSINYKKRQVYERQLNFIKPYHNCGVLKVEYLNMIKAEAEQYAEMVLDDFRSKLAFKLGPVIDRKGGGTVKPYGSVSTHAIHITFPDDSGFTVRSQIVHAVSKNGVFFSRHPMTFHNVTYGNGTKMNTPSAEKMLKEFGIDISDTGKENIVER